ncbi:hypothetical protein HK101_007510, partial [Irineochytrium annulatum]
MASIRTAIAILAVLAASASTTSAAFLQSKYSHIVRHLNPNLDPSTRQVVESCMWRYIVAPNDDCTTIAASQGISPLLLVQNNPRLDCNDLHAGHILCLSPTANPLSLSGGDIQVGTAADNRTFTCTQVYTVAANDTCASVAKTHSISQVYLNKINPDVTCFKGLAIGAQMCVYSTLNPGQYPDPVRAPTAPPTAISDCTVKVPILLNYTSCDDVVAQFNVTYGLTILNLLKMNKRINCVYLNDNIGAPICVQSPSYPPNAASGTGSGGPGSGASGTAGASGSLT